VGGHLHCPKPFASTGGSEEEKRNPRKKLYERQLRLRETNPTKRYLERKGSVLQLSWSKPQRRGEKLRGGERMSGTDDRTEEITKQKYKARKKEVGKKRKIYAGRRPSGTSKFILLVLSW